MFELSGFNYKKNYYYDLTDQNRGTHRPGNTLLGAVEHGFRSIKRISHLVFGLEHLNATFSTWGGTWVKNGGSLFYSQGTQDWSIANNKWFLFYIKCYGKLLFYSFLWGCLITVFQCMGREKDSLYLLCDRKVMNRLLQHPWVRLLLMCLHTILWSDHYSRAGKSLRGIFRCAALMKDR